MNTVFLKAMALLCLATTSLFVHSEEAQTVVTQNTESSTITNTANDTKTTSQENSTVTTTGLVPFQAVKEEKHWAIGVSSYSLGIFTEDNSFFADDDDYNDEYFVGGAFFVNYHFSESISARVQFYALEHDDYSEIEISGVDVLLYWGSGFLTDGFKWYIGGGGYSETLELGDFEEDFSGAQISGGIGYNWEHIGLDFSLGARTTSDYEDFIEDSEDNLFDRDEDMFALTAALGVYVRF